MTATAIRRLVVLVLYGLMQVSGQLLLGSYGDCPVAFASNGSVSAAIGGPVRAGCTPTDTQLSSLSFGAAAWDPANATFTVLHHTGALTQFDWVTSAVRYATVISPLPYTTFPWLVAADATDEFITLGMQGTLAAAVRLSLHSTSPLRFATVSVPIAAVFEQAAATSDSIFFLAASDSTFAVWLYRCDMQTLAVTRIALLAEQSPAIACLAHVPAIGVVAVRADGLFALSVATGQQTAVVSFGGDSSTLGLGAQVHACAAVASSGSSSSFVSLAGSNALTFTSTPSAYRRSLLPRPLTALNGYSLLLACVMS